MNKRFLILTSLFCCICFLVSLNYVFANSANLIKGHKTLNNNNPSENPNEQSKEIEIPFNTTKPFIFDLLSNKNNSKRELSANKQTVLLLDSLGKKVTALNLAGQGKFKVVEGSKISFKPVNNFLGAVKDVYFVVVNDDGSEIKEPELIKIKVKPVGVNDFKWLSDAETKKSKTVTLNVLANDGFCGKSPVTFETLNSSSNIRDLTVNFNTGDITFILPDTQIQPDTFIYTYRLKTKDAVYSNPIKAKVLVAFSPAITLNKTPNFNDTNNDGLAQAGETITYTFSVENTGNVDIEKAKILDSKIKLNAAVVPSTLKPTQIGKINTVPEIYVITPADTLAGRVLNTATTSALEPITNTTVTDTSSAILIFPILKIELIKSGRIIDSNGNCLVDVGDKIEYTFTVTNKGTVDVYSLVINDPIINLVNQPITPSTLAPGKSGTLTPTNTYAITKDDIISVENTAVASGKNIQNTPVKSKANNTVFIGAAIGGCNNGGGGGGGGGGGSTSKMFLLKKAVFNDTNKDGFAQIGETITYTFTVTNTGKININNITINDAMLGMVKVPINPTNLAPNQTGTVSYDYVLTQANIDAGKLSNKAFSNGLDALGNPVSASSGNSTTNNLPTDILFPKNPKISLLKTSVVVDVNKNNLKDVGDRIDYIFTVTNTGNVTVNNINITDNFATVTGGPIKSLAPNMVDNTTIKASYIIKQSDIDKGYYANTAIAKGFDPKNNPVEDISGSSNDTDDKNYTPLVDTFFIPNVFTPNGDGINDTFEIFGIYNFKNVEIEIFNRWGNQVYKNLNYKNEWLAEGLNEATYYYTIKLKTFDNIKTVNGWVLVKR